MKSKKQRFVVVLTVILVLSMNSVLQAARVNLSADFIKPAISPPVFAKNVRHAELAARRKRVAGSMEDNSILILFSAPSRIYSNDVDYVFRQENNLFYLTEINQNGITLVISKTGGRVAEQLFLPKRNPRFEMVNGKMLSDEQATEISGVPVIVDSAILQTFLTSVSGGKPHNKGGILLNGSESVYLMQGDEREYGGEMRFGAALSDDRLREAVPLFSRLRLVKSSYETAFLRHAIDITSEALMRSMGMAWRAKWEYEVHAEVEYTFRRRNADSWGFPAIVGSGPNATTLHYVESQGKIGKNDLLLMDIGAEYKHYTADVTRTFPVSGKFSKEQAEIYKIVYDAQNAAAKALKPGATIDDASDAADKVIIEGLFKLGLITNKKSGQHGVWYPHGWGHWLGMNVHDVGNYGVKLSEGMIMTNEPGLYFRADTLKNLPDTDEWRQFKKKVGPVFEKYKNIGVRIEDDMLITKNGVEWLTAGLPRSIPEIERFMAGAKVEMNRFALIDNQKMDFFSGTAANFAIFDGNVILNRREIARNRLIIP